MEKTIMNEIVAAMTAYICDKLCRHPLEITDTEELDRRCGGCLMGDHVGNILNAYSALELLRNLEKDKIPKWVPVSMRVPEDKQEVLCTDGAHIYLVEYDEEGFEFDNTDIIAWMPLPEPYREEV